MLTELIMKSGKTFKLKVVLEISRRSFDLFGLQIALHKWFLFIYCFKLTK